MVNYLKGDGNEKVNDSLMFVAVVGLMAGPVSAAIIYETNFEKTGDPADMRSL